MEVCVQWPVSTDDDSVRPRDTYVASLSGCAICVSSHHWTAVGGKEIWAACLPANAVAGVYEHAYLAIHLLRETEKGAFSVIRLCDYVAVSDLAVECKLKTADGKLQMSASRLMAIGHGMQVSVRVRLEPTWQALFADPSLPTRLPAIERVSGDPVPDCYTIATSKRVGLAAWASAAFSPVMSDGNWNSVARRYIRQAELAACLLGHDLSRELTAVHRSEIAAELLLAPLRAHGVYVVDTTRRYKKRDHRSSDGHDDASECDIPSVPLFRAGCLAAYDCEDSAAFAVRSSNELWQLLQLIRVRGQGFGIDTASSLETAGCAASRSAEIAACLELAAMYAPLILTVKRGDDASTLHVMALLASRQGLLNLFGQDWQMALTAARLSPAGERKHHHSEHGLRAEPRIDIGIELPPGTDVQADVVDDVPPCIAEACALMSGCLRAPQKWKHSPAPDYRSRFMFGLSEEDTFYGNSVVVAVYGAACGKALENRNITLMQLLKDVLDPGTRRQHPIDGDIFFYPRCVQTLLPGPAFPVECAVGAVPSPIARDKRAVLRHGKGDVEFRLFDGIPCMKLSVVS